MKKMLMILVLSSMPFAQMGLSAYGGLNMANMSCDDCEGQMKIGPELGFIYPMLPVLFRTGISMRGIKETDDVNYITSMEFLYLNSSAQYLIPAGQGKAWLGLDFGINLSATMDFELIGDTCTAMKDADKSCSDSMTIEDVEMDYGISLGYAYPITDMVGIYLSYYMGLAEVIKESTLKHNGIGLGATYAFSF